MIQALCPKLPTALETRSNPAFSSSIVLLCMLLIVASGGRSQQHSVDFRYAPAGSYSVICLPDDWQKSVITSLGELGYDFGPGPYAQPLTRVSIGVREESLTVRRHWLPDPRVPVICTEFTEGKITSHQQVFALIPPSLTHPTGLRSDGKVLRTGGLNGCRGWASPSVSCDPAFRTVAWGTNRPITYKVRVDQGGHRTVALGFCESYKTRTGSRLLDCRVEGAPSQIVDPVLQGSTSTPVVRLFKGIDANQDGWITVEVHPVKGSDPNVILNAIWVFPESVKISEVMVASGSLSERAELYHSCGTENEETAGSVRQDAMTADFSGGEATPVVRIRSGRSMRLDSRSGIVYGDERPFLLIRPRPTDLKQEGTLWVAELPRGSHRVEVVALHGVVNASVNFPNLKSELQRASRYWQKEAAISYETITVPDSNIQYLIYTNLRNLYQVREVVDGAIQFQPGPSVYRGLWLGDVMLSGIPAMMYGDVSGLREFLEGILRYQLPSGQFKVMVPMVSLVETPVVLFTMCWYAAAANNDAWLRQHWRVIRSGIQWLDEMRKRTSTGLMPAGFVDGGIAFETADYGSVYWAMVALERSIEWAMRLGEADDAAHWQGLLDDFHASFTVAARRDMKSDRYGTPYLPVAVADTSTTVPQRGQYAFLLPLRDGRYFLAHLPLMDSVVQGTLTMLDSVRVEGIIAGSGWMGDGIWPWLGSAHGIGHQITGSPDAVVDLLYAVANHASTLGTWVEEQAPRSRGKASSGDASNAEASACFLHLIRNTLLMERLDTLHCLASLPPEWLHPGANIEATNAQTEFGSVTLRVVVSRDGGKATVMLQPGIRQSQQIWLRIHFHSLQQAGFSLPVKVPRAEGATFRLDRPITLRFNRVH